MIWYVTISEHIPKSGRPVGDARYDGHYHRSYRGPRHRRSDAQISDVGCCRRRLSCHATDIETRCSERVAGVQRPGSHYTQGNGTDRSVSGVEGKNNVKHGSGQTWRYGLCRAVVRSVIGRTRTVERARKRCRLER